MTGDLEGNVPLWEAILGKHEAVIRLLIDNGAGISTGDVAQFACMAAEQNSLELLQDIVRYGGDVTLAKNDGATALHHAVCEGNLQIVRFLIEQGASIDKQDIHGWTPRNLAEQQGHEDIKALFQVTKECEGETSKTPATSARLSSPIVHLKEKFKSDSSMPVPNFIQESSGDDHRSSNSNFHNSLFGIMSAAHAGRSSCPLPTAPAARYVGGSRGPQHHHAPPRVTISCPEKGDAARKLVLLPRSLDKLLNIGAKKFGVLPAKVLTKDGAEIDDVNLIRDGDHLVLVGDDCNGEDNTPKME